MELPIITILDGMDNMDFQRVTDMLAKASWCPGISRKEVEQGAANSALVVGAFFAGAQIGYSRVISDKTRFAYLSDVYVNEAYRGHGIGPMMVEYILAHESLKDVYQWALYTTNAQHIYAHVGFKPLEKPECWMQIRSDRPNR